MKNLVKRMIVKKKILILVLILFLFMNTLSIQSINSGTFTKSAFTPEVGTFSTYAWNFTGFRTISVISSNGEFVDYNNITDLVPIENPIDGIINVSIQTYELFLMENVTSITRNETTSIFSYNLFLINTTTREYVNEDGIGSSSFANSYIDPNNLSVGDEVWIGSSPMNITSIEMITVSEITREAYKLYIDLGSVEITGYYDTETGIMLSFSVVNTPDIQLENKLKIYSGTEERRNLIYTNAFENLSGTGSASENQPGFSSGYVYLVTLMSMVTITRIKKRN